MFYLCNGHLKDLHLQNFKIYNAYLLIIYFIGLAKTGKEPPKGFMAPAAWKVLSEYYQSLKSKMDTN